MSKRRRKGMLLLAALVLGFIGMFSTWSTIGPQNGQATELKCSTVVSYNPWNSYGVILYSGRASCQSGYDGHIHVELQYWYGYWQPISSYDRDFTTYITPGNIRSSGTCGFYYRTVTSVWSRSSPTISRKIVYSAEPYLGC